jgi:hypothetical protein
MFIYSFELRRGSDDYLGEWLSRAGSTQWLPPLCYCQIRKDLRTKRVVIKYNPRIKTRKTHTLVFHLGNVLDVTDGNFH